MNNLNKTANIIKDFLKVITEFPEGEWVDCLSSGQMDSKLWIIDELEKLNLNLGKIFLFGGWYGTLSRFLLDSNISIKNIRSFDIDDTCHEIAETLNRPFVTNSWIFKATTFDILNIKYPLKYNTLRRDKSIVTLEETPDTIINTSCEHMNSNWYKNILDKTLIILQSNNFEEIKEHINCVKNLNEMKLKYPMSKILFEGKKELQKYNRYMLIGYK